MKREAAIPFRSATLSRRLRERAASHLWSNLTKFSKVSTSAWVGTTAINYGGRTYNVPSGVLIWNRDGQSWFTGGVDAAISYGGTMNLYVKDGIVRAIEIGG